MYGLLADSAAVPWQRLMTRVQCRCLMLSPVPLLQAVYLINEHQPDRTTSETPYFCYSHLLMKLNVGAPDHGAQKPNLDALRKDGTDQQDAQLAPDYFDVRLVIWYPVLALTDCL
jgi:hypothetical protein